jgi:hypothetical protein
MGRNNKDQEILGKIKHSYERSIVSQIKTIVANFYNVPLDIYATKSRKREVITIKHTAIYLSYHFTSLPLVDIGALFNSDHSTIIHTLQKMNNVLETEVETKQIINQLKREIKFVIRTYVKDENFGDDFYFIDMNDCKSFKVGDNKYVVCVGLTDMEIRSLHASAKIREHNNTHLYLLENNKIYR